MALASSLALWPPAHSPAWYTLGHPAHRYTSPPSLHAWHVSSWSNLRCLRFGPASCSAATVDDVMVGTASHELDDCARDARGRQSSRLPMRLAADRNAQSSPWRRSGHRS